MHFGNYNQEKSIENAKWVLNQYSDWHRIEQREFIQSTTISDMPKGSSAGNSSENGVINHMSAKILCATIKRVIEVIEDESYRIILEDKYLKGYKNSEILDHLAVQGRNIEPAQFFRKQNQALFCFAEYCPPLSIADDGTIFELLVLK